MQKLFTCFLLCGLSTTAVSLRAQNFGNGTSASAASSPTGSKSVESMPMPNASSASEEGSASVSGAVLDASGAAVPGAKVTLTEIGKLQVRSMSTGPDGSFTFSGLSSGSYMIVVTASGFQQPTSAQFKLTADQQYQVPNIRVPGFPPQ
ncbi:MAG: carboxypeptidase-like regulatory domain-containing protein [Acidobacteriaceae bacterium]